MGCQQSKLSNRKLQKRKQLYDAREARKNPELGREFDHHQHRKRGIWLDLLSRNMSEFKMDKSHHKWKIFLLRQLAGYLVHDVVYQNILNDNLFYFEGKEDLDLYRRYTQVETDMEKYREEGKKRGINNIVTIDVYQDYITIKSTLSNIHIRITIPSDSRDSTGDIYFETHLFHGNSQFFNDDLDYDEFDIHLFMYDEAPRLAQHISSLIQDIIELPK